ncbi:MarC family protein [Falsiroseomonas oryziterrae]|uniref:MarC family protein n=1 Tax=Falsiroseomonas oryziterrae TaxID=2911368 RepID=UPI001F34D70F|nr:MarC family protein [Roseomonas sp. NPKOSM-4]
MIESFGFALVALLVIVDPVGTAVIFAAMTTTNTEAEKRRQAIRATVIAALVLLVFAVLGGWLLRALGIGLPAMKVAGGLLLFLLAADMVMGQTFLRATPEEQRAGAEEHDVSVFPLAIPLLAGPGGMTSMVLMTQEAQGDTARLVGVFAALVLVLILTLVCLLAAGRVARLLGKTGGHVIGRVLGVLLAGLAAQIALEGVRQSLVG